MFQANADDTLAIVQYYKTLEARFDHAAKLYDATYGPPSDSGRGNALMGWLQNEFLTMLCDIFPAGAGLLDLGSGTGNEALAISGRWRLPICTNWTNAVRFKAHIPAWARSTRSRT
jgi:hypothetical protein